MSELQKWFGVGEDTNSTEKTFSRKKHMKKRHTIFDGFEPAGKQRFEYDSNILPTPPKEPTACKSTAVSKKLVPLPTPFQSDLIC
jgi:hypothetical protein